MIIKIKPSDIVKRCLWDNYKSYILTSKDDPRKMLEEDKEFEISERDALVIGLLAIIETNNLIHKFNVFMLDVLSNKSIKKDELLVRVNVIDSAIKDFMNNFPTYWVPEKHWRVELDALVKYVKNIKEELKTFDIHTIVEAQYTSELYLTKEVKKLLKFQY